MERKVCFAEVKEYDEKSLIVEHFISTERRDRGGDVLYSGPNSKGKGMILNGMPVVLHSHGLGPQGTEPIAKCLSLSAGEFRGFKGIKAKTQFYPDETGKRLFQKTTQGFYPSWSIGWRVSQGKSETKYDGNGDETRFVYEWELLEYSLVAVPMQPDAQTFGIGDQLSFKVMKESRGTVVPYRLTEHCKDDEDWDASAEINKASIDDLKEMAVWYDGSAPTQKSSYQGIHHKARTNHPVHKKGVQAVAKMLMIRDPRITEGELRACREHIAHHYDDLALGDPPWKGKGVARGEMEVGAYFDPVTQKAMIDSTRLDAFFERVIRQTVRGELERVTGKIPQRRR